ncbi:MAG: DUF1049 domain-containing protein [Leptolyngbya sp. IPPAS B-1204]|uniref:DUF1049 domain-containing protein n=1 Tax=Leptolyngbya sp. NK1-12 TaxID=2547451 RepID=A0AA96WDC7_9CYAN|nr:DUF1049 domain-containing protein [Leptolyngbya sp. NK1-12]MBF2051081.1 DUF1049 domain-containing protein [Elainella sp. C42_A2020_010]RNJ64885.1 MAG: DUF1049 domain-containing protein [Leptolyngbya sp. IPPAS B-1204]WNZ22870.1 DUF1049 domain-containing protein [Leptolyngbya sp. NK1-12]
MSQFFTSLVLAIWISAIALIAIQNATPISLQFLNVQSVEIPLGLILAFSTSLGLIGSALAIGIWRSGS